MLVISDLNKDKARDMAELASMPEYWYVPGVNTPPGDVPGLKHVFDASTSCAFSWTYTVRPGYDYEEIARAGFNYGPWAIIYRQISMRGRKAGTLPHPMVAFTIASWFGLTGGKHSGDEIITQAPADWLIGHNKEDSTIVIAQEIPQLEVQDAVTRAALRRGAAQPNGR